MDELKGGRGETEDELWEEGQEPPDGTAGSCQTHNLILRL